MLEMSLNDSCLRVCRNELLYHLSVFDISVFFTDLSGINFDESIIDANDIDYITLSNIPIEKIIVHNGSFVYYDSTIHKECIEHYRPYTFMTYRLVRKINKQFDSACEKYTIGQFCFDDSCSMCDDVFQYGFQIEINKQYWSNLNFFQYLVDEISHEEIYNWSIASFYDFEQITNENYELKYISTNTKTRRIGYLKILLSMFIEHPQIPISRLNIRFEQLCQYFDDYRKIYKNTKGNVIVTKKGTSAEPYIELAQKIGLIIKGSNAYRLGKNGKTYIVLAQHFTTSEKNPFNLNDFDKYYFGELLLREDYWFIYTILEQALVNPVISFKKLKYIFKDLLLHQIDVYINDANSTKNSCADKLQLVKRQISQWEKPEVYMEHILMPRLNWLYDLGYIELNNDLSFGLTMTGERLLFHLSSWNDSSLTKICSSSAFLEKYYMKMINDIYELKQKDWCISNVTLIEKYLEKSFALFKTLAPNRITYSMFVSYLKYSLFILDKVVIDEENIRNLFETNILPSYILKIQVQYKDGYIQKINKTIK